MKDLENVVNLHDYIAQKKEIVPLKGYAHKDNLMVPQSVLHKRVIAFGVDLLTIGLLKTSMHTAYAIFVSEFHSILGPSSQSHLLDAPIALHLGIFLTLYFSYFLFCNFVLSGKTLGKKAMGLRVVRENYCHDLDDLTYEIELSASLKRSFGYLLCYLSFGTFFIFNFASEDKRGMPDYLSSTRTVSDEWLAKMQEFKLGQREHLSINIQALALVA